MPAVPAILNALTGSSRHNYPSRTDQERGSSLADFANDLVAERLEILHNR
jgi:hypothetical protein